MPVTVRCTTEGCGAIHILQDDEYTRKDGKIHTSLYNGKCGRCRLKMEQTTIALARLEQNLVEEHLQNVVYLKAECENGHQQVMKLVGYSHLEAEHLGKLLDGSSSLFLYPPGPDSPIGKCGACGKQIKVVVMESLKP